MRATLMQVRVANRQDEPEIRNFVDAIYKQSGSSINLESEDSDLRNIEANYFGKEGLFIVLDEGGTICGIAAARKKSESVLEFRRLLVSQTVPRGAVRELVGVIVDFAPRLLYESIEVDLTPESNDQNDLLRQRGFQKKQESGSLSLSVTPDF